MSVDRPFRARVPGDLPIVWVAPSYNANWADLGGGFEVVRYGKVGDEVIVRGVCARSSGVTLTPFTLPTGFRPTRTTPRLMQINNSWGAVQVDTAGVVSLTNSGIAFANGHAVALDIRFHTTQP